MSMTVWYGKFVVYACAVHGMVYGMFDVDYIHMI